MNKPYIRWPLVGSAILALGWSFWFSPAWLQLCAGVALFLFGMQCLEEGLRHFAGGRLEQWLAQSTATATKSLVFGIGSAILLQSSTLVSLLGIAFVSAGLIQLSAAIAMVFGANLGATSGIWLLAMAGQNFSLAPLALPLVVLGVLAAVLGEHSKMAGRTLLGVAFIFLAIDQIRAGFEAMGGGLEVQGLVVSGLIGQLLFAGLGVITALVVQSGHATLLLALTALSTGQLLLWQALAIALGANLGSSLSTALVGMLSGNRSGQQLVLAHVLFNAGTALVMFFLLTPAEALCLWLMQALGAGDNPLLQLALFQTLFNALGVLLFWPGQTRLERLLHRWLPDAQEPSVLITQTTGCPTGAPTRARYLSEAARATPEAAAQAVLQELHHLERLSLEVICHALYQPITQLSAARLDETLLHRRPEGHELEAEQLYRCYIKGVYADLLAFMSRLDNRMRPSQRSFWVNCQLAALQLVDAVKDAKHLQKNLGHFLRLPQPTLAQQHYLELRRQLLWFLRQLSDAEALHLPKTQWQSRLQWLDEQAAQYDQQFRQRLFSEVREQRLDSLEASSLMNDLGYVSRIIQSLRNVVILGKERPQLFKEPPLFS